MDARTRDGVFAAGREIGVDTRWRDGGECLLGAAAQLFQHAFERVQVAVMDHQPALAGAAVEHVDLGVERFRQFALEADDVGLGLGLVRPRALAFGHPAERELL